MYEVQIRLIGGPNQFPVENMIVLLVGRGQTASNMLEQYNYNNELKKSVLVAIEPLNEWYPCPNGIDDQEQSIEGLKFAVPQLNKLITNLQSEFNLTRDKIALVGFSAGAVMAIQLAANSNEEFAAVVSHAGAILDPDNLPQAKNKTPILLIHSEDDDCFSWEERYLPMKKALAIQGFNLSVNEVVHGGHYMLASEAMFFLVNNLEKRI